jgi:hypothetical protein
MHSVNSSMHSVNSSMHSVNSSTHSMHSSMNSMHSSMNSMHSSMNSVQSSASRLPEVRGWACAQAAGASYASCRSGSIYIASSVVLGAILRFFAWSLACALVLLTR